VKQAICSYERHHCELPFCGTPLADASAFCEARIRNEERFHRTVPFRLQIHSALVPFHGEGHVFERL